MLRLLTVLTVLLATPALGAAQSLEGVWRGTQLVTIGPDGTEVTEVNAVRLLIYTDAFYMWTFVGEGDRPTGQLTDEQFLEGLQGYGNSAGTYIRDGVNIIYNQYATLNPNGSLPQNQPLVRQIRSLTRNRLVTQGTNAEGVVNALVYERVE